MRRARSGRRLPRTRRAGLVALSLLTAAPVVLVAAPALGAAVARATSSTDVSAAAFGANAGDESGPAAGSLRFTMPSFTTTSARLFFVHNTGDLALTGQTYTFSSTQSVTFSACLGGSWSGSSCSGTVRELGTANETARAAVLPLPVGETVQVRAAGGAVLFGSSVQVTVAVDRNQARAATTTSS